MSTNTGWKCETCNETSGPTDIHCEHCGDPRPAMSVKASTSMTGQKVVITKGSEKRSRFSEKFASVSIHSEDFKGITRHECDASIPMTADELEAFAAQLMAAAALLRATR